DTCSPETSSRRRSGATTARSISASSATWWSTPDGGPATAPPRSCYGSERMASAAAIRFEAEPASYRHWVLDIRGDVATLAMNVAEDGGLHPGYALKLNSYDLGVDIELADALQRLRFSHPEVRAVVLTSVR